MRQAKHQRKALLIISDGGDNHSRYTEKEIVSVVKEADVMIYGIGIYNHYFPTQEEILGPELLRTISEVDRKSTRLNSSHRTISYAVFCLNKKNDKDEPC